ncbi:TetR/AcrR family transcriptional regulator [Mycobacterium sp.]|uniref:TetR/AcrR family transcriptional regulator n=1 Tax=Mycobacterium sp. TaxID=1785 RepID=UPI002BCCB1DC|nr:TetR/AcrR family transcriptional regulator [Mycobacterium sp.]HKP42736.1 TetR/AcrR family transcriptional regulator [Mycobacterium sp.]
MPKIVDQPRRRREVIDAAFQVISQAGLEGATLRAIAEQAGFTTGVIGHYFSNKEDLLAAALRASTEDTYKRISRAVGSTEGLRAVRAAVAEVLPDNPHVAREWAVWLCYWGRSVGADPLVRHHRMLYQEWHTLLTGFLLQAVELGEVGDQLNPEEAADCIISVLYGIAVQTMINGMTPEQQHRQFTNALDSVLAAYAPEGPTPHSSPYASQSVGASDPVALDR